MGGIEKGFLQQADSLPFFAALHVDIRSLKHGGGQARMMLERVFE